MCCSGRIPQVKSSHPTFSVPLIAFNALYCLLSVGYAVAQRNTGFLSYVVVMAVLITSVILVHKRVNFSSGVLWELSAWGALHLAGGLVHVPEALAQKGSLPLLYSWWLIPGVLKYDQVIHAFGFGITTWACWQILRAGIHQQTGKIPEPTFGLCLLSAAGGMGFGALNEVVEFFATLLLPVTNIGDYTNTGWDLVSNLIGCALAAVLIRRSDKKRSARS
jgi:hypothetical protein